LFPDAVQPTDLRRFFVLVTSTYWTLKSWAARKNLLLVASYIFYGAWNPPFALLLFATTTLGFWLGARDRAGVGGIAQGVAHRERDGQPKHARVFQKRELPVREFPVAARARCCRPPAPRLVVFLPIGISFYTFHSLSYTLDVYRGATQPTRSLRDFLLAVSFCPQLVAGPIVRAADLLPQCAAPPVPRRAASAGACC